MKYRTTIIIAVALCSFVNSNLQALEVSANTDLKQIEKRVIKRIKLAVYNAINLAIKNAVEECQRHNKMYNPSTQSCVDYPGAP